MPEPFQTQQETPDLQQVLSQVPEESQMKLLMALANFVSVTKSVLGPAADAFLGPLDDFPELERFAQQGEGITFPEQAVRRLGADKLEKMIEKALNPETPRQGLGAPPQTPTQPQSSGARPQQVGAGIASRPQVGLPSSSGGQLKDSPALL